MCKGFCHVGLFSQAAFQKSNHWIPESRLHISTESFKQIRHILTPSRDCPIRLVSWDGFRFSRAVTPGWTWSGRELETRATKLAWPQCSPELAVAWGGSSEGAGPAPPPPDHFSPHIPRGLHILPQILTLVGTREVELKGHLT